ncbi:MAG: type II toxin-antitoxin system VapC family toxin [Actinomycetales bacterium]|uniref:Ribonuclease VapC n=1 Tax=Candidatus Phosphoribacter hodrii TaxID=2953743 RepID=A0A9D7TEU2_9MICO|nr:type II toxin-antitoxin system VapC family toxin [Candidatus Phosphoribacter hodrii]
MVIYLDTSALAKLVVEEAESADLAAWLDARPDTPLVTSTLTRVELLRAARRRGGSTVPRAIALLAELALIPLDDPVLDAAVLQDPAELRTLDALHRQRGPVGAELDALVTYDERMAWQPRRSAYLVVSPVDLGGLDAALVSASLSPRSQTQRLAIRANREGDPRRSGRVTPVGGDPAHRSVAILQRRLRLLVLLERQAIRRMSRGDGRRR